MQKIAELYHNQHFVNNGNGRVVLFFSVTWTDAAHSEYDNLNAGLYQTKSYIQKIKDLITINDQNKMKYFINALYKVSKIYIKSRTECKDPSLDNFILDMYQGCIYECDLLDVFENYKEIALLFKEINKDLTNE